MGCDLHAVVVAEDRYVPKSWQSVMSFSEPRHYAMFYAMAGVRYGDAEPVAEARGLPAWWKESPDLYLLGDHSYSWLTTAEFAEAIHRVDQLAVDDPNNHGGVAAEYHAALAFMRALEHHGRAALLVFGFDS